MVTNNVEYIQQEELYLEAMEQARIFVQQFLIDNYPELDLERTRVLNDLLVEPAATVNAYNDINMDRARRSMSLYEIEKDPTLADDTQVDRILSNWNISRKAGTVAEGLVSIVVSDNSTIAVPVNSVFTVSELSFITTNTIVATSGELQNTTERPILPRRDGNFVFTLPVSAVEAGSAYTLRKGQEIVWEKPSANYISAYVESDFTGGEDAQTNQELMDVLSTGVTSPVLAGRENINSLILNIYPNTTAVSTTGYGDAEMLRDSHNLFGIKMGGKGDVYVKTSSKPEVRTFELDCFIIDKANKIFQVSIGRELYPGFYDIFSVVPLDIEDYIGSLEVLQDIRGIDISDLPYPAPEMDNNTESAYTRFQTAVIQFTDPEADLTELNEGDTTIYKISLLGRPGIATIQDQVSTRSIRPVQADYLVRAPIPLAISVELEIQYVLGDKEVNEGAALEAAVMAINNLTFDRSTIPTTLICEAVQATLEDRAVVAPNINLIGNIRYPSGARETMRSSNQIVIPNVPEESTSSRTVNVYTDYNMISITLKQVETLSI